MKYCKFIAVTAAVLLSACANTGKSGGPLAEMNLVESEVWMLGNRRSEGVVTTPSGLQYKILSSANATGCKPEKNSTIRVHYSMRIAKTGSEVDSSFRRGVPSDFKLNQMIEGWELGIPMMDVGESWEFYIPPHLAYGSKGSGRLIPPNVVLISRVNLMGASNCRL